MLFGLMNNITTAKEQTYGPVNAFKKNIKFSFVTPGMEKWGGGGKMGEYFLFCPYIKDLSFFVSLIYSWMKPLHVFVCAD